MSKTIAEAAEAFATYTDEGEQHVDDDKQEGFLAGAHWALQSEEVHALINCVARIRGGYTPAALKRDCKEALAAFDKLAGEIDG